MADVAEDVPAPVPVVASDGDATIRVTTVDGGEFELPMAAARISQLLNDSMPERDEDDDDDEEVEEGEKVPSIELLRVSSECLQKVVDFMVQYHNEPMNPIPTPLGASRFEEVSSVVSLN